MLAIIASKLATGAFLAGIEMASYKELKLQAEDLMRQAEAAKFRNAATGESWSGRGRVPKWLAAELAKGRKREEFLVG